MDIKIKRGQILKELRENKHLRQSDLATILDVTQQAYQRYESGTSEPNGETVCKLADFYGVTTDYLLGREPPNDPLEAMGIKVRTVDDDTFIKLYRELPDSAKKIFLDVLTRLAEAAEREDESTNPTLTKTLGQLEDETKAKSAENKDGGKFA